MKAIEQYFHVLLFIVLFKVVLNFKSVDETLVYDHWNVSYWYEQYFHMVLYYAVLTLESVDKTLVCDHSNKGYQAVNSFHKLVIADFFAHIVQNKLFQCL